MGLPISYNTCLCSESFSQMDRTNFFRGEMRLTLKNVGLPCSYLPTQNRPYPKNVITILRILFFIFFSLILLTNPSLKSLKAVF